MTSSPDKRYIPGKGFVDEPHEAVAPPCDTEPQTDDAAYQAQREAAQMERIGASMDRAMGRRPDSLIGVKRQRDILGEDATRTDNRYDALGR